MSDKSETSLDRHYGTQLRMMGEVLAHVIKKNDAELCFRWLEFFHKVTKEHKYARNSLLFLMYKQLKDLGKLEKPFTQLENMQCQLDDVLIDYGKMIQEEVKQMKQHEQHSIKVDIDKDPAAGLSTTVSICENSEQTNNISCKIFVKDINPSTETLCFDRLIEQNRQLMNAINKLHLEKNEQRHVKLVSEDQLKLKEQQKDMLPKIKSNTLHAIKKLQNWTNGSPLHFLSVALQDIIPDEPEARRQLLLLDGKLERVLHDLVEQASAQREQNVRKLYDQVFEQQLKTISSNENKLRNEREAVRIAEEQFQAHLQDLKQRELRFYEQKAKLYELPCVTNISQDYQLNFSPRQSPTTMKQHKDQKTADEEVSSSDGTSTSFFRTLSLCHVPSELRDEQLIKDLCAHCSSLEAAEGSESHKKKVLESKE